MKLNIFRHELKQSAPATVGWTAAVLAVAAVYVSVYPAFAADENLTKILEQFPEALKKAFGVSDLAPAVFAGFYKIILTFVLLLGAVQAMSLGLDVISKETRLRTADFLLTKPVKRTAVLTQKMFASALLLVFTNIVFLTGAWALIKALIEEPLEFDAFLRSSFVLFLVQLFFFALGFFLGVVLPKVKSVIGVTLPVVFGFYILGLLDTVIGEEKIKYLTPFKFFNLGKLTAGENFLPASLAYSAATAALLIAGSYFFYQKKDIRAL